MKILAVGCIILSALFSSAAYSRGGGSGSHHSSMTGGAFGTQPTAPGTNSAGTALSGGGSSFVGGPPLGTGNPAVDAEDRKVSRIVSSICRGC